MQKYDNMSPSELQQLAYRGDREAEYQFAMRYFEASDWRNAIIYLKKIVETSNHPRRVASTSYLAQLYAANGTPYSDKKEAVRLFESIKDVPTAVIARLNLGFLYCEMGRTNEGLGFIENTLKHFILEDGNDNYLKQIECYKIGIAYEGTQCFSLAIKYYTKAINRCDKRYESDRGLIQKATEAIADCNRRKSMGLEDMGKYRPAYEEDALKERERRVAEKAAEIERERLMREEAAEKERTRKREQAYINLLERKTVASSEQAFANLANEFRAMGGYKDTASLAEECDQQAAIAKEKAYEQLLHTKKQLDASTEPDITEYRKLANQFRKMGTTYKDVHALCEQCEKTAHAQEQKNRYNELMLKMHNISGEDAFKDLADEFRTMGPYQDAFLLAEECEKRYKELRSERFRVEYTDASAEMQRLKKNKTRKLDILAEVAEKWNILSHRFKGIADYGDAKLLSAECEQWVAKIQSRREGVIRQQKAVRIAIASILTLGVAACIIFTYIAYSQLFLPDNTIQNLPSKHYANETYEIPRYISNFIVQDSFDYWGFILSFCLSLMPLFMGAIVSSVIFSICKIKKTAIHIVFTAVFCGFFLYLIFGLKYFTHIINLTAVINIMGIVPMYILLAVALTIAALALALCGMNSRRLLIITLIFGAFYLLMSFAQMITFSSAYYDDYSETIGIFDNAGQMIIMFIAIVIAAAISLLPSLLIAAITHSRNKNKH